MDSEADHADYGIRHDSLAGYGARSLLPTTTAT